jgi:transglutaminase superfamily protein
MMLAMRIWFWAAVVRVLKHVVPLPLLVRWVRPRHQPAVEDGGALAALGAYLDRRGTFPSRPPGNCLDRSLAAYRVLCASGSHPRLVAGIRPLGGGLDGHVWLVLNGVPFAERADVDRYVPIVSFDEHGQRDGSPGPAADLTGIRWA